MFLIAFFMPFISNLKFHANEKQKKAGVPILISEKIDLKKKKTAIGVKKEST